MRPDTSDSSAEAATPVAQAVNVPETLMTPESSAFIGANGDMIMADSTMPMGDEDLSDYFKDLAERFGQGIGTDQYDWDNILSDLNSSFV